MKLISAAAFLAGVAVAVPALAQTYNPATNAVVGGTNGATTGAIIGCIVTIPGRLRPGCGGWRRGRSASRCFFFLFLFLKLGILFITSMG